MGKIKLCIFDMDGLLLDTERKMWADNNKRVLKELGLEYDTKVFRSLMGGGLENSKRTLEAFYGNGFSGDAFYNRVFELNKITIEEEKVPPMPGVFKLLDFVKENGIKTAIASSTESKMALKMINSTGLTKYIDNTVFGDEVTKGKPDPEIYLKAFNKFEGINKDEVLVFEDAHHGARAGLAAGFKVILVPSGAPLFEEDEKDCLKVLDTIDQAIDIIKDINNIK